MATRHEIVVAMTARAAADKRPLYGYHSDEPGCYRAKRGKVADEWNRVCVEGDAKWVALPLVNNDDE